MDEFAGVPVGEAEAAEGLSYADFLGGRGAVDAEAGTVKANPGDADGVVGAGRDGEFPADGDGFGVVGEQVRIKGVLGIFCPDDDLQGFADGSLAWVGGNGTGEVGDEVSAGIEGAKSLGLDSNFDSGQAWQSRTGDMGDGHHGMGRRVRPSDIRIEPPKGRRIQMKALGDLFFDGGIPQAVQLGAFDPGRGTGAVRRDGPARR